MSFVLHSYRIHSVLASILGSVLITEDLKPTRHTFLPQLWNHGIRYLETNRKQSSCSRTFSIRVHYSITWSHIGWYTFSLSLFDNNHLELAVKIIFDCVCKCELKDHSNCNMLLLRHTGFYNVFNKINPKNEVWFLFSFPNTNHVSCIPNGMSGKRCCRSTMNPYNCWLHLLLLNYHHLCSTDATHSCTGTTHTPL